MPQIRDQLRRFAVHAVLWRHYLDFALANVPFYLRPILIFFWTIFFFFFAAPARRSVVRNLGIILPDSSRLMNHLRAFRTLLRFAQTITDAANFRVNKAEFDYEIVGPDSLEQLGRADGAVLLTAHMGNYDLGAALFAQKFSRQIRMVRAPEPHRESEQHLAEFVKETGQGAVRITYSSDGALVAFDLLNALRNGEIVSIQGDRVTPGVASVEARLFGARVLVPSGPFTLALVSEKPIVPLFVVRAGYYCYRIIAREPITVTRGGRTRNEAIASAAAEWCKVLESVVAPYWDQWFAFVPIFTADES
ncbi:MAG: lysophospholipid acyltransferase family protein [Verrucomicrobiota bacterium]|nr:lysophospholipid acyltransferase family protein [Verrucomicrobiota bacterium]